MKQFSVSGSLISVFLGLAHLVSTLPTSTTTTTTTTPAPTAVLETGEPVAVTWRDPCIRCERFLEPYYGIMRQYNMTAVASVIDSVCDEAVPAVEECKKNTQLQRCQHEFASPWLPTFNFFCQRRAVVKSNTACWSAGHMEGMQACLDVFIAEGPTVGACQGIRNMLTCARNMMQQLPNCSEDAITFVLDYLKFGGQYVCPDRSYA